ncbi:hypothetical protein Y032_0039g2 [Ancylostoma ceylanicum]|uniref:Regulator of condensation n=1 Tax=Ancylostoma ceylanicum TaxID=53326 RepID=A0A016UIY3_9BILA|nr:hypothetical protein Y032_0039g2 [Ancylostoma ceylanicum]
MVFRKHAVRYLMQEGSGDFAETDESKPLWIIHSRFDEIRVHKSSFVVLFPLLDTIVRVDVGSDIVDICSTHNYVVVVTREHIYVAHKDNLEDPLRTSYELKRPLGFEFEPAAWSSVSVSSGLVTSTNGWSKGKTNKPSSDAILTCTVSTVYFVYTVDGVSTVVRLFNEYNFLESGAVRPVVVQIPEDVRIVMAASGNDHSLFLTDKGALFALGTGRQVSLQIRGELGIGLIPRVCELTWLEALEGVHVVAIAAAGWHSAALTGDGDVYLWGWNHRGQLGDEKEKVELYPSPLDIDLRVVKIELKEHLTALWVAEDGEEPSILMGSDEIGMPPIRLHYYNQVPDKKSGHLPSWLTEDPQVDMVFLDGKEQIYHGSQDYICQEDPGEEFELPIRDRD